MTLSNSRFNLLPSPPPHNYAAQKLSQLQADLVSTARIWAADEVGAAMAHQLSGPLTALLIYLHKIKDEGENSPGAGANAQSIHEIADQALRETERVCEILERLGYIIETPVDAETAVARGREVIDAWMQNGKAKASDHPPSALPQSVQHLLTPREREVLTLIVGGSSNKEGGYRLGITTRTFEVHRAHIMEKVGARNAADLVRKALS